jgi:hypothetical protein
LAALIHPVRGASDRCSAESMKRRGQASVPTTQSTQLQSFVSTLMDARRHLAAAAVARSVSIFGMYPIDTIKVRFGRAYSKTHKIKFMTSHMSRLSSDSHSNWITKAIQSCWNFCGSWRVSDRAGEFNRRFIINSRQSNPTIRACPLRFCRSPMEFSHSEATKCIKRHFETDFQRSNPSSLMRLRPFWGI